MSLGSEAWLGIFKILGHNYIIDAGFGRGEWEKLILRIIYHTVTVECLQELEVAGVEIACDNVGLIALKYLCKLVDVRVDLGLKVGDVGGEVVYLSHISAHEDTQICWKKAGTIVSAMFSVLFG